MSTVSPPDWHSVCIDCAMESTLSKERQVLSAYPGGNTVQGTDIDLIALLGQRYGDGLVYLRGGNDHALLQRAIQMGLVSDDGYLTPSGQHFCASGQG